MIAFCTNAIYECDEKYFSRQNSTVNNSLFFSGRSLVRLTDNSLLRLEIVIPEHRQAILREISKLRLRSNILLLKEIEMKQKSWPQQSITEVN